MLADLEKLQKVKGKLRGKMYGQEIQNEEQLYNSFKEDFSVIVIDL